MLEEKGDEDYAAVQLSSQWDDGLKSRAKSTDNGKEKEMGDEWVEDWYFCNGKESWTGASLTCDNGCTNRSTNQNTTHNGNKTRVSYAMQHHAVAKV